jgi:hypothetical protein
LVIIWHYFFRFLTPALPHFLRLHWASLVLQISYFRTQGGGGEDCDITVYFLPIIYFSYFCHNCVSVCNHLELCWHKALLNHHSLMGAIVQLLTVWFCRVFCVARNLVVGCQWMYFYKGDMELDVKWGRLVWCRFT